MHFSCIDVARSTHFPGACPPVDRSYRRRSRDVLARVDARILRTNLPRVSRIPRRVALDPAARAWSLAIVDARCLEQGTLARAWFNHHLPPSFHGIWVKSAPLSLNCGRQSAASKIP